jgi:alpha-N-arabinofuranosidase
LKSIDYVVNTVFVDDQDVKLRIRGNKEWYDFEYAEKGKPYQSLGKMNCSLLSTEVAGGFTGVVIGMMAEGEPSGYADFRYYEMKEK